MTNRNHPAHPHRIYKVGYKRPPTQTRYKKGQSGNPKGRPRKTQTAQDSAAKVLSKKVAIVVNGRVRKITILEAAIHQIAAKAVKGDLKATKFLIDNVTATNTEKSGLSNKKALIDELMKHLGDEENEAG